MGLFLTGFGLFIVLAHFGICLSAAYGAKALPQY